MQLSMRLARAGETFPKMLLPGSLGGISDACAQPEPGNTNPSPTKGITACNLESIYF